MTSESWGQNILVNPSRRMILFRKFLRWKACGNWNYSVGHLLVSGMIITGMIFRGNFRDPNRRFKRIRGIRVKYLPPLAQPSEPRE